MYVCVVWLSVFVFSEYTWTYVLVKSVESKVPTALAYDVARSSVGCQLRCRPRHLTAVQNYEANVAVLKLCMRLEIGSRKLSNKIFRFWFGLVDNFSLLTEGL